MGILKIRLTWSWPSEADYQQLFYDKVELNPPGVFIPHVDEYGP